mmetsp:Transcript_6439/g.3654  ORF Transcript_6439/g.3654 Transcript_6439/m.3654 type:complete len:320 (-) Transcript_6439:678-1637(-)
MYFDVDKILVSDIDLKDYTYRISTKKNSLYLKNSINCIGIINLPILRRSSGKKFSIVSGFHRISTCLNIGWKKIPVRILSLDTKENEYTKIAVSDNSLIRPLNLVEQARALTLLSKTYACRKEMLDTASLVGLPNNSTLIEKIMKISMMPHFVQESIINGTISLMMAFALEKFSLEEKEFFIKLFNEFKLSLNMQRQIITLAKEISKREDIAVIDIFKKDVEIRNLFKNKELELNKKSKVLKQILTNKRYPSITYAKKQFKKSVSSLALNNQIKFEPPVNFEGSSYTITMNFKNIAELKNHMVAIDSILADSSVAKILE